MLFRMRAILSVAILVASAATLLAAEKADIIVAKDGSGDFTTIQAAVNSIPSSNNKNVTILVKNGTYTEHLGIDKSNVSLIGESREKTIIEFSVQRTEWTNTSGSSIGCAVINIGCSPSFKKTSSTVTDIVIGNLTVQNTYNTTSDKTMVIKDEGNSNRISVISCNVWCKGHDTISLWSKQSGMYYHANCSFKGSIDAVCPRGWCYTVGCDFYEGTSSSPLWHEVAAGSTQKFVIRTGKFYAEGGNFRLLNSNNSSSLGTRYFLLDCMITSKATTQGNFTEAYYYNCHGEKSDQSWYADNLSKASGSPKQQQIAAKWTFDNKWDPENALPAALPFTSMPQPWDSAYDVASDVTLVWIPGRNAAVSALYFGTGNPPPFKATLAERTFSPGKLSSGKYYWKVDAVDGTDTVRGAVWSFTTIPGVGTTATRTLETARTQTKTPQCRLIGGLIVSDASLPQANVKGVCFVDLHGRVVAAAGNNGAENGRGFRSAPGVSVVVP